MKTVYIDNVRYVYQNLLDLSGILKTAKIELGDGCEIGNDCLISAGCKIGSRCRISADCKIGNGCLISADCKIGSRCRISAGFKIETSPLYIASELPFIFNGYADRIQIGCKDYTIDEWLEKDEKIADEAGIADANIICKYHQLITLYSSWRGNQ